MWYRQVLSGVVDSLRDDFKSSGNLDQDLFSLSFYHGVSRYPNKESLLKFFNSVVRQIPTLSYNTVSHLIQAIQAAVNNYVKIPEEVDFVRSLEVLLANISQIINGRNPKVQLSSEKIKEFSHLPIIYSTNYYVSINKRVNDNTEIHDYIYNTGYNSIINNWESGLQINPAVMMTVMTNLDKKSSENLGNQSGRDYLKELIVKSYPIYEKFDTDKYSKQEIVQTIIDVINKSDSIWNVNHPDYKTNANDRNIVTSFFKIGISAQDYKYTLTKMIEQRVHLRDMYFMQGIMWDDAFDLLKVFVKNDNDNFESFFKFYFAQEAISLADYREFKDLYKNYYSELSEIFSFIGSGIKGIDSKISDIEGFYALFGFYDDVEMGLEYLIQSNSYYGNDNHVEENILQFPIDENIKKAYLKYKKEYYKENPEAYEQQKKLREEFLKRFLPGTSYMLDLIEKGDIVSGTLESLGFSDDTRSIAHSMSMDMKSFDENEKSSLEIIDFVIKNTPVYLIKNMNFYAGIKPHRFSGVSFEESKSLGFFIHAFSPNIQDNFSPAIFINDFHSIDAVRQDSFLKNLGLDEKIISRLTTVHEISHLLHYVQLEGASGYFGVIAPTYDMDKRQQINKSRVYLTDMREITARVFGNTSLMKYLLHDQLEVLSVKQEFRDACMDEMIDHMMEQEYLDLEGTSNNGKDIAFMTSATIKSWAGSRRGIFGFGNANEAAMKKIERIRRYLKNYFSDYKEEIKRSATLEVLKKINSNKRLLSSLKVRIENENPASEEELRSNQLNILDIERHIRDLNTELQNIRQGKYISEYELAFNAIANFMSLRGLEITNEIVSDPLYNPPKSVFEANSEKMFNVSTTPLTREELKEIRDFDLELTPDWGKRFDASSPFAMDLLQTENWRKRFPESYYPDPKDKAHIIQTPIETEESREIEEDPISDSLGTVFEEENSSKKIISFNYSIWRKINQLVSEM